MHSITKDEVTSTESTALLNVITQWGDYDKETVLLAYQELKNRNFLTPGNNSILTDLLIDKSISGFCHAHRITNMEIVAEMQPA
jgi:hypothetical protein